MAPKVKSATALAKEAADAAAAAAGGHEDSFADAEEDTDPGISKDLLAYIDGSRAVVVWVLAKVLN